VLGCPIFLQQKLKRLKLSLKVWKKNVLGNVHEVVVGKKIPSFFTTSNSDSWPC